MGHHTVGLTSYNPYFDIHFMSICVDTNILMLKIGGDTLCYRIVVKSCHGHSLDLVTRCIYFLPIFVIAVGEICKLCYVNKSALCYDMDGTCTSIISSWKY